MLFNSYEFLLAFLPLALLVFHALQRLGLHRQSIAAVMLLSLVYYGWWNPKDLLLFVPTIALNFLIARAVAMRDGRPRWARPLLVAGIAANLGSLAWFKYANFAVDNVNAAMGTHLALARVVLPLGISFFTFQMIASLVDAYQGKVPRYEPVNYALFVSFFPHLFAGPMVHHREMMPQFRRRAEVTAHTVALGLTILAIGLAKKVLLADPVAAYVAPRFDAAAHGAALTAADAWAGALAYTAQLYFDFSGYSDMAIGAGLLFGIRLPVNFASPYKAESIVDFWRRWHITLSRFLREYLYIPLGGNRQGPARRHLNLFLTMLLGGLWHGAAWTFVAWGALHGAYLAVNHAWRTVATRAGVELGRHRAGRAAAWAITFLAVVVGWVFFRAASFGAAGRMLAAMAGAGGPGTPVSGDTAQALAMAGALLVLARFAPSTQELTGYTGPPVDGVVAAAPPASPGSLRWRPSPAWAAATGVVAALALLSLSRVSEFIYFQF